MFCALSWAEGLAVPTTIEQANEHLDATSRFWRTWLGQARIPDHEFRPLIQRAALTIKGLTYMPTGATVAALTTSLPETPGGERNWDYRYTWIRDSTFTLQALHYLDLDWEANEFMAFIADLERNEDGALQIMYGIDGRRDLTESLRDELSGYAGAHPVRIGNGAFDQRQNDVFGAALDSVLLHTRRSQRLPRDLWPLVQSQAECATAVWRQPDQGIWEARGKPQHYVSSKLMCWVALDRAAKLAGIRGESGLAATWAETATEIKADILEHGVDKRGVLRQHYETDALDASTLLAALFGFLPGDDKRMRASVLAIADELTEHGFVLRYRTDETDDGLSGKEGTFVICSFWLVSALAVIGEMQRARDLMQRLIQSCLAARAVRRGVRRRNRASPRELPAGVLTPRAGRGRRADHRGRTTRGADGMSHYDVIIIGTGAGGGTLARHLAPSGKRILLLERGGWLPREPQNMLRRGGVRRQPLRAPRTPGATRTARSSSRGSTTASAARPSCTARRCTGCARRTSASANTTDGISPAWPVGYDEFEPYYTLAEQRYSRSRGPRRGSDRAARERAVSVPGGLARAADPAARRRPGRARPSPVPRPVRGAAQRGRHAATAPACAAQNCDGFPCIVHAKSDAEVLGVRPALEHDNVELLIDAEAIRARDRRRRDHRHRGGGRP